MTVKTLTASTISEALADARRQFGDDVVLLESHPPSADRPARIMIMAEPAATMSADGRSISRVIERVKSPEMAAAEASRSEEHTSELQSRGHLVCRLLLER